MGNVSRCDMNLKPEVRISLHVVLILFFFYRYAYVEFECSEESTAAMSERNEQELNGQAMNIEYFIMSKRDSTSRKSGAENPSKTLYVGNLSEYTTEQSLKDSFGNAISARMPTNHATGGHRGLV